MITNTTTQSTFSHIMFPGFDVHLWKLSKPLYLTVFSCPVKSGFLRTQLLLKSQNKTTSYCITRHYQPRFRVSIPPVGEGAKRGHLSHSCRGGEYFQSSYFCQVLPRGLLPTWSFLPEGRGLLSVCLSASCNRDPFPLWMLRTFTWSVKTFNRICE